MENITNSLLRRKIIKQGINLRIARTCRNVTQEGLAFRMNMTQSKISALEFQDKIDDKILVRIAKELDVPVDFLKNFDLEMAIKYFSSNNGEAINGSRERSSTNAELQGQGEQENIITNFNYPLDKITELYDKIIHEKEKQIFKFEKQIEVIQIQLEELKKQSLKK